MFGRSRYLCVFQITNPRPTKDEAAKKRPPHLPTEKKQQEKSCFWIYLKIGNSKHVASMDVESMHFHARARVCVCVCVCVCARACVFVCMCWDGCVQTFTLFRPNFPDFSTLSQTNQWHSRPYSRLQFPFSGKNYKSLQWKVYCDVP